MNSFSFSGLPPSAHIASIGNHLDDHLLGDPHLLHELLQLLRFTPVSAHILHHLHHFWLFSGLFRRILRFWFRLHVRRVGQTAGAVHGLVLADKSRVRRVVLDGSL